MKQHLRCCACDEDAGCFEQHWNRDDGFGICARCATEQAKKETPERMLSLYGVAGVSYAMPTKIRFEFNAAGEAYPPCG